MSIQQWLPEHYNLSRDERLNLPAIIDALDDAFTHLESFIEQSQNQLYLPTASGQYLLNIANSKGFSLARGSSIGLEGFKKLAPIAALAPKQCYSTMIQLLEAFYSQEFVRPSVISDQTGPYSLMAGDSLVLKDAIGGTIEVAFPSDAFPDFTSVSVDEIVAYLNAKRLSVYALSFLDRSTNLSQTRLLTQAYGASASIQVIGGTAASIFKFPYYHEPLHGVGTKLRLTKPAPHSDEITIQYDAAGSDPGFYRLAVGDFISFRNLFDVSSNGTYSVPDTDEWGYDAGTTTSRALRKGNYSILNGYHEVVAIGYDFCVIRKAGFFPDTTNGTIFLRSVRDMHFQQNRARRLYDQDEYAVFAETAPNTVTVSVPAVPPIVKRYLQGSWHIHAAQARVDALYRQFIDLTPYSSLFPSDGQFTISSPKISPDYNRIYRTLSTTGTTWTLDPSGALFPFDTATIIDSTTTTPLKGALDSDIVTVTSENKHWLWPDTEVTLSGVAVNEGLNVNGSWPVISIVDDYSFKIRISTKMVGVTTTQRVSIVRLLTPQADGSNAYLQFANLADLTNSGITTDIQVQLVIDGSSVVVDPFSCFKLIQGYMGIVSIDTTTFRAYIVAPIAPGVGAVVTNTPIRRAIEAWGGAGASFRVDWTRPVNAAFIAGASVTTAGYNAPENDLYLGSYLFDPDKPYTLTQYGANLSTQVLRGTVGAELVLDTSASTFPSSGYVAFAQGTAEEEGPIRYTSVYLSGSNYYMRLDPTYRQEHSHAVGTRVSIVGSREPIELDRYGQQYQIYITGTVAARNKLFDILEDLVAAGVFVAPDVNFPALKFADPQIEPYV